METRTEIEPFAVFGWVQFVFSSRDGNHDFSFQLNLFFLGEMETQTKIKHISVFGSVFSGRDGNQNGKKRSEVAFLEKIVDDIYNNKVARKLVDLPRHLTGMNARYEEISSWLEQSDKKVLVIFGMGGSGKTTLANYIVSLNSQHFESIVIVRVMGGIGKQDNQHELLRKFVSDLFGAEKGVWMHRGMIDRALKKKKALIVFDDVDEPNELERFLGTGDINKQSKIIITTRKNKTHGWLQTRSWSCEEYNMQLLNNDEALELLSLHAFGFKIPKEGYEEHTKEVLQYCEGNPWALEVLGSSLSEDNSIRHWESTLDALKKDMDDRIHGVLITSYNSLPRSLTKELFLHIACFFVGEDKDYVEQILENDYCAPSGIKALINRCLLSVSPNNKLMMYRLVQEMGKNIIRKESKRVKERSRVFDSHDSYNLLRKRKPSEDIYLTTDSLRRMDILKLLKLKDVHLHGNYKNFPDDLRWLCWHQFRFPTIPFGLFQGKLVAIDMSHSNLEVFEPPIVLQSLKTLNLQGSKSLLAIRKLYVYDCKSLEKITFESHRFTMQEFGYGGCAQLFEVEGFFKLMPIANLVETELRHMAWLKNYQYHEVSLVGDDELTLFRTKQIQMLYEFGIMSTSLPDIKDPNMIYEYSSESPSVCFRVPSCPENKRLIGLNVSFKYTILEDDDPTWFVKIHTNNGVDYMYNPHVFGHPGEGKVGIWLSFWPIGSKLVTGDEVNVSIVVMSEIMEAKDCGASLVYAEDDETMEINMPWVETLGGDLSAFQLSTGANYLCRRDFFKLMEVGGLTRGWLSILVGSTIDDREVRGWRKTGRPNTSFNPSRTESSHPLLIELSDSSFNPSQTESSRPSLTKLPDSSSTAPKKF
ncbi:hypothetical protein OSB04_015225 [Centaurea solstitialis]|uniref:NB-ARC domain-containing protein n=1 Tax=Centaurea solstitialis TaxID=347529 RepID=A0AA38WGC2_9ASTR|nr:hypothetical protein OSB04_015225 [Centaurea solstitialis]